MVSTALPQGVSSGGFARASSQHLKTVCENDSRHLDIRSGPAKCVIRIIHKCGCSTAVERGKNHFNSFQTSFLPKLAQDKARIDLDRLIDWLDSGSPRYVSAVLGSLLRHKA